MIESIRSRLRGENDEARRSRLRGYAAEIWEDNELNIDDDAKLSEAEDGSGAWVQAWVWIDFEEEDNND